MGIKEFKRIPAEDRVYIISEFIKQHNEYTMARLFKEEVTAYTFVDSVSWGHCHKDPNHMVDIYNKIAPFHLKRRQW